jgi:hypothetical protein
MKPASRFLVPIVAMVALVLAPGGCPVAAPQLELPTPTPGSYWITEDAGQLYYFQFPQDRDEQGQWIPLDDQADWFEGPGFYRLDEDLTWSPDVEFEGMTLDELLQVYDPPPAVPDSKEL